MRNAKTILPYPATTTPILNCVVVDDEALARRLLIDFIDKVPFLCLVRACSNAIEAQQVLQEAHTDLLLLDIQIPDLTGLELLRVIKNPPPTIITTAYAQHALVGYELEIIDYLLKPFSFERFFKAVSRALELHKANNPSKAVATPDPNAGPIQLPIPDNYIFVKSGFDTVKVFFKDILFIEAKSEYVCIHTVQQKIMTLLSLQKCGDRLPPGQFSRIHRSYIVSIGRIERIQNNMVKIASHNLPIGKNYRVDFLQCIEQNGMF